MLRLGLRPAQRPFHKPLRYLRPIFASQYLASRDLALSRRHVATDVLTRTLSRFSLEDRVYVVTGGAGGLGLIMSEGILESGGDVAIVDLDAVRRARELCDRFDKMADPPRVKGYAVDVGDHAAVERSLKSIVQDFGRVDGLVTCAGFTENFPAISYPNDRYKALMRVNVDGTYYWATSVARHLLERKVPGSLVLVASMSASIINKPQVQTPYNASKAAVKHMASSLAVEWAEHGIRVSSLSPGYMATNLTKAIIEKDPEYRAQWVGMTPMQRLGEPQDLKGAVIYLLSDASTFVTGIDLVVDGGYTKL